MNSLDAFFQTLRLLAELTDQTPAELLEQLRREAPPLPCDDDVEATE
jgi:hypothetical protein